MSPHRGSSLCGVGLKHFFETFLHSQASLEFLPFLLNLLSTGL